MQDNLPELYARAIDAYNAGRWNEALQCIEACLAIDASRPEILHLRGRLSLEQDNPEDAERWLLRAVEGSPDPAFYNSLAVAQTHVEAFGRAADSARAGLAQALRNGASDLDLSMLYFNLGRALYFDRKFEEAIEAYSKAIGSNPRHGHAHNNLGTTLSALGRLDDAIAHFQAAVDLQPENAEARCNLGHALLAAGRYRQAWPHFHYRWTPTYRDRITGREKLMPARPPLPEWDGSPPVPGSGRLLVLREQGFGDILQFCRYLPLVLERFSRVTFEGSAALRRLFMDSFGSRWPNFEYIDASVQPVDFREWDMCAFLMALPVAFDTDLDTIPATIPYLFAEPGAIARWRARLDELDSSARPRIGIVWAGSDNLGDWDEQRSMRPEDIDPLIAWPHARWISLQKPANETKALLARQRAQVVDWMDEVNDYADTAALIASLDLVVSVDTSVAHLAGAMGKPVWLLNRAHGCWRWMRGREDTPWYPNMRLFTQAEAGEWDEVLNRILAELEKQHRQGSLSSRG